jgi:hypothetical protein
VIALTGQTSTQAPQKVHFSSTTATPSFMLNAPKGQAETQDSHPVQVSLSINSLAIHFSSYIDWKIGIMEYWNVGLKNILYLLWFFLVNHYSNIPSFQ